VLFLGDQGVGKTSIITTIATDTFKTEVPKVFPSHVPISPDMYQLPNAATTILVDTSTDASHEAETNDEIKSAHVIVLVYDVNNLEILKRLKNYWLPRIQALNDKVPVILCGNKIDLRSASHEDLESTVTSFFMDFRQVDMAIECSCKDYKGLIDMISCAQKAVLYPVAPLHDSLTKKLKPAFEKALVRIFRVCDKDKDGYLSDQELKDFQAVVFKSTLESTNIQELKIVLTRECEEYTEGETSKGISFQAFLSF
jgi:Ras family protein T1